MAAVFTHKQLISYKYAKNKHYYQTPNYQVFTIYLAKKILISCRLIAAITP